MRLESAPDVDSDLDEIAAYMAARNPPRALSFALEIQRKILTLAENAFLYQLRSDIGENARVATVGQYLIVFRVKVDAVLVERVVHGLRDMSRLRI